MILVLWAMPVFVDIHNCRMQVPGTFSYQRERDATLQAHHCSDDIFLLVTVTYYPVYRYVIMLYKSTHWFSMSLFCTYIIQYISSHCIASYLLPLVTWHDIVYHYVNYHSWAYIASHHITSHCTDIVTCYFSLLLPLSLSICICLRIVTRRTCTHIQALAIQIASRQVAPQLPSMTWEVHFRLRLPAPHCSMLPSAFPGSTNRAWMREAS